MARSSAVVSTVLHRQVVAATVVISARVRVTEAPQAFVCAAGTENDVEELARNAPTVRFADAQRRGVTSSARTPAETEGDTFVMRPPSRSRENYAAMRIEERVRREVARARRTR